MKRIFALFIVVVLMQSLVSCGAASRTATPDSESDASEAQNTAAEQTSSGEKETAEPSENMATKKQMRMRPSCTSLRTFLPKAL